MKRILIYIIVLIGVWFAPVESVNVGQLHPVELVMVTREGEDIVLTTDTGDMGQGADGLSALENLKATATGTVYLDTAEFLLLTEGAEDAARQLRQHLKPSVRVCMAESGADLVAAAKFLSAHGGLPRFKHWKQGDNLPRLQVLGERFLLIKTT